MCLAFVSKSENTRHQGADRVKDGDGFHAAAGRQKAAVLGVRERHHRLLLAVQDLVRINAAKSVLKIRDKFWTQKFKIIFLCLN
jgi:hypothetical protein